MNYLGQPLNEAPRPSCVGCLVGLLVLGAFVLAVGVFTEMASQ